MLFTQRGNAWCRCMKFVCMYAGMCVYRWNAGVAYMHFMYYIYTYIQCCGYTIYIYSIYIYAVIPLLTFGMDCVCHLMCYRFVKGIQWFCYDFTSVNIIFFIPSGLYMYLNLIIPGGIEPFFIHGGNPSLSDLRESTMFFIACLMLFFTLTGFLPHI